jgi:hypothetical protein
MVHGCGSCGVRLHRAAATVLHAQARWAGFMIAGSLGPYAVVSARDHGNGAGQGAESAAAGAGATTEVPGPGRRAVTPREPHPRAIVPASAAAGPARWFPAVPSTASCPRASLVACSYKHRVRWSGLKSRGLIPAPVIAVNAFRSRAVPDNSCPARNGERRPPWGCLAPIRPPLFLSHAMKGDAVFQPSQGTTRPEGDNAS